MKKSVFIFQMLLIIVLIHGCVTMQTPPAAQQPQNADMIDNDAPETMEAYAKMALDDIQIERDAQTRLEKIEQFYRQFPETRHLAQCVFIELITLGQLERKDEIPTRSAYWLARFPSDSRIIRAVAETSMQDQRYKKHVLDLARKALAIDLAGQTPFVDLDETEETARERETSYRLTLIQALLKNSAYAAAMKEIDTALTRVPHNDSGQVCALYRFKGDVFNEMDRYEEAQKAYLDSVIIGDPRRRHSEYALKQLESFFPDMSDKERMDHYREMVGYTGPVFDDVTEKYGLAGFATGRVAWGDFDRDGYPDILLNGSILLKNVEGTAFVDISEQAGMLPGGHGGLFADVDNDGYLDILVLRNGPNPEDGNRLLLNDGTGRFIPADPFPGIEPGNLTEGAAWCDLNGDGLVDLYLANYEMDPAKVGGQRGVGTPDEIYLNVGDGKFINVSAAFVPPGGTPLSGRGVSCADFNNDGKQDVFVSNYRLQRNFLWVNHGVSTDEGLDDNDENPAGNQRFDKSDPLSGLVFRDEALDRGVAGTDTDGWWGHTIGSVWGDLDNDGNLDLFSANLAHPRYIEFSDISQLLINSGPPDYRFTDRIKSSGITYDETHSNPALADIDNDGDLDLYITSIYEDERSYLYLNDSSGLAFQEVGFLSGTRAFNGWGCAWADFDGDGFIDLLVGSGSGVKLFRNRGNSNHWIQVQVTGTEETGSAIGARITVTQNSREQIREIQAGSGTTSQDWAVQHFGFGDDDMPVTIHVLFTTGVTMSRIEVPLDQRVTF
ncbi:MAG: CRTAC1 family protein [bacterium]